jgi:hypothetical protein
MIFYEYFIKKPITYLNLIITSVISQNLLMYHRVHCLQTTCTTNYLLYIALGSRNTFVHCTGPKNHLVAEQNRGQEILYYKKIKWWYFQCLFTDFHGLKVDIWVFWYGESKSGVNFPFALPQPSPKLAKT